MDIVMKEKSADSTHKYEDGIHVVEEDGYLKSADGTSLGADNGLAVAYAMDLLIEMIAASGPGDFNYFREEVGPEGAASGTYRCQRKLSD